MGGWLMKLHDWTLEGKYLLKAVKDIGSQLSEEEMAEECGFASVADFKKELEIAPNNKNKVGELPEYLLINGFLASKIGKGAQVFMTMENANKFYGGLPDFFEELDEEDEDDQSLYETYDLDENTKYCVADLEWITYVNGELVEDDDQLNFYEIKKEHVDPDSPFLGANNR